jgi:arginase
MHSSDTASGTWDVLVSPWHENEGLDAFPSPAGSVSSTRSPYPASSESASLIERFGDITAAVAESDRPLLLSGDCLSALGVVTGLQRNYSDLTVIWLDAHGDFNTPEISTSGYLAGMSLAMVTGRAPEVISRSVGLRPVPDDRALLIGARDLDDGERDALDASGVRRTAADPEAVIAALADLRPTNVYVHVDLDILDGGDLPVELRWRTSAGPAIDAVEGCLEQIAQISPPVGACVVCPWPPERIGEPAVEQTICRLTGAMGAAL